VFSKSQLKVTFEKKIQFLSLRNRDKIMLQQLIIHFLLHYLSSGHVQEVKNPKKKFQIFSSKSGCGRLREVVTYKGFQIYWYDLELFGILEKWSLRRESRNRRFDCIVWHSVLSFNNLILVNFYSWVSVKWLRNNPAQFSTSWSDMCLQSNRIKNST